MAASANPSGNQEGGGNNNNNGHNNTSSNGVASGGGNPNNGNSVPAANNFFRSRVLKHNPAPGLALTWTAEEQLIMEEGLIKYASETSVIQFANIAMELPDKTARDVALRHRWMTKKENGKRRKDDHTLTRKNKDRKEKVADPSTKSSSHLAARPNAPPYSVPMIPMDNDDGISFKAIGGATGQLLEQNAQVFNQISANFASYQYQENINLFCQTRDNILTILNDLNDMPGIMKQMPPLPVKMNEELANSILPRTSLPMQQ
ncbi:Protein of unknown function DUF3755 [Macleaya cordata]|uniref:Myb-like domain-containing protein n=1 Tax=Macleaya cordata TaxID=56857 RepID=A0A200PXZ4_MACCD|nr:Protein of unknown function DUF3755 [Macleaya cordata]